MSKGYRVYCHINGTELDGQYLTRIELSYTPDGKDAIGIENKTHARVTGAEAIILTYREALDYIFRSQRELLANGVTEVYMVHNNTYLWKWIMDGIGNIDNIRRIKKVHSRYSIGGENEIMLAVYLAPPEMPSAAKNLSKTEQYKKKQPMRFVKAQDIVRKAQGN